MDKAWKDKVYKWWVDLNSTLRITVGNQSENRSNCPFQSPDCRSHGCFPETVPSSWLISHSMGLTWRQTFLLSHVLWIPHMAQTKIDYLRSTFPSPQTFWLPKSHGFLPRKASSCLPCPRLSLIPIKYLPVITLDCQEPCQLLDWHFLVFPSRAWTLDCSRMSAQTFSRPSNQSVKVPYCNRETEDLVRA